VKNQEGAFDLFKVMGFPENPELAKQGLTAPALFTVTKITDPDVAAPTGKPAWFVGQLPPGIKSASGMSGGPVFGFRKIADNLSDCRVVAMQSWANPNNGIVYGTPLNSFTLIIDDSIKRLGRELQQESRKREEEGTGRTA